MNITSKNVNMFSTVFWHNKDFVKYFKRGFSVSCSQNKEFPTKLKGRSKSSQEWLIRQLADPYVEKAKMMNYRCRSAFKLIEIDERFRLLSPGQCVIDCGAAPGSWTQVAVNKVNSNKKDSKKRVGQVIGIDLLPIYHIEGATILQNLDFTTDTAQQKVLELLNNRTVDVVLSDMAPNATGIREMDHENIIALAYSVLRFAVQVSSVGASLLIKIWAGRDTKKLENDLARFYENVKPVKPGASRGDSAEMFFLARKFKGLKT
ncbi:rRNA methyltransferase 2 [Blattella germanica]|nr:rRNA methyltransferase 2 [Blattella germanica]